MKGAEKVFQKFVENENRNRCEIHMDWWSLVKKAVGKERIVPLNKDFCRCTMTTPIAKYNHYYSLVLYKLFVFFSSFYFLFLFIFSQTFISLPQQQLWFKKFAPNRIFLVMIIVIGGAMSSSFLLIFSYNDAKWKL